MFMQHTKGLRRYKKKLLVDLIWDKFPMLREKELKSVSEIHFTVVNLTIKSFVSVNLN